MTERSWLLAPDMEWWWGTGRTWCRTCHVEMKTLSQIRNGYSAWNMQGWALEWRHLSKVISYQHEVGLRHFRWFLNCSYWGCIKPNQERTSLIDQLVKTLPTMQETWVRFLSWEDPLKKETAIHSSFLAWRIPWTEESGGLQSMGSQESDTI